MEGEVAEDAFVQLLDELHEQGVRVHLVVEEGQQILLVALGLLQVIVRQRAEVRALVQIFETDLRRWKKKTNPDRLLRPINGNVINPCISKKKN